MKRTALLVALVLLLAGAMPAFAYKAALGGEFGLNVAGGLPNSALLSFRLPKFPPVIGLGVSIPDGGTASAAVLLDWWLYQGNLVSFINYYVGPGIYLQVGSGVNAGLRVPVGLDAFPIPPLEVFVEFAPAVGLIAPSGVAIPNWGLQAGFGFRFWF